MNGASLWNGPETVPIGAVLKSFNFVSNTLFERHVLMVVDLESKHAMEDYSSNHGVYVPTIALCYAFFWFILHW